jgi:hypothetical protein
MCLHFLVLKYWLWTSQWKTFTIVITNIPCKFLTNFRWHQINFERCVFSMTQLSCIIPIQSRTLLMAHFMHLLSANVNWNKNFRNFMNPVVVRVFRITHRFRRNILYWCTTVYNINCSRSLKQLGCVFESHCTHECLSAFILFVLSCV